MKRATLKVSRCAATVLIVVTAFAALSLVACSSESSTSSNSSTASSQDSGGSGQEGSSVASASDGVATMADGMRDLYDRFDTFDAGIRSGKSIPTSLRIFVTGTIDGYVHDKDVIIDYWKALSSIRIDAANPIDKGSSDKYISFSFKSGSGEVAFSFSTNEYADFLDDKLYPVAEPDEVAKLVDSLVELAKEEAKASKGAVYPENGSYLWDADGDGSMEYLSFDIIDNGDEARNVLEIELRNYLAEKLVTASIEGGYGVETVEGGVDEKGPYVVLGYAQGDYYTHDVLAHCKIRLEGDELTIEDLD